MEEIAHDETVDKKYRPILRAAGKIVLVNYSPKMTSHQICQLEICVGTTTGELS
jgi:hypothetical protein